MLIDEIENAGVERRRARDLPIAREEIVLMSTHDPILAVLGRRRLVLRNGAVACAPVNGWRSLWTGSPPRKDNELWTH